MNAQKILTVLAEGGGMYIERLLRDGNWVFRASAIDHTPTMIGDEPIDTKGAWVGTLEEALGQVGWPWNAMVPKNVHPDCGEAIFRAKLRQDKLHPPGNRNKQTWIKLCGVEVSTETQGRLDGAPDHEPRKSAEDQITASTNEYPRGQLVQHIRQPAWGIGEVVGSSSLSVRVRFGDGVEREFQLPLGSLTRVND